MEILKLVMLLLGLVAILLGLRARFRNRHAQNWPSVPGQITRSELQSTADGQTRLNIAFRYEIDGRVIDSRPIVLTIADVGSAAIHKILKRLTMGRKVTVFYDPADPKSATVDHSPSGNWLEAVIAGLALVAFALVGF